MYFVCFFGLFVCIKKLQIKQVFIKFFFKMTRLTIFRSWNKNFKKRIFFVSYPIYLESVTDIEINVYFFTLLTNEIVE